MSIELNKIIHGDCLEILKGMPDKCVDLVLTDPPYGISMDQGFQGFGGFGEPIARKKYKGGWDKERPSKEYFDEILRVSKKAIIFGGNFFADILPQGKHWIVWDKLNSMPTFGDCELIWTNIDRNSVKKITRQWNGLIGKESFRDHPSQKPLDLIKKLMEIYSEEGGGNSRSLCWLLYHSHCRKTARTQLHLHRKGRAIHQRLQREARQFST